MKHELNKPEKVQKKYTEKKISKGVKKTKEKAKEKHSKICKKKENEENDEEAAKHPNRITPEMYTKSKIVPDQKVYLKKELDESDLAFLTSEGFIETEQTNIDGQKRNYIVFNDKFESPIHIICIKEIVDYLKDFTEEIKTYRTVMPDIVFTHNNKEHAIEVETGVIIKRDKKKLRNKIDLLNKRYGNNWFFFVTNRNLEKEYSKLGETSTKRNIKSKINKIFQNY
ncbi:MAG: hypothetical protein KKF50_02000 [Nanoarchaeota archaeon]|nr:hypothetical protein [Nanoarchaeota archaeon]